MHAGLAAITGAEELKLDHSEAHDLAQAAKDVLDHYPALNLFDSKTAAWIMLTQTCAFVYGSRLMAWRMRSASVPKMPLRSAPQPAPAPGPSPVMQAPGGPQMNGNQSPPIPTREIPPEARVGEIPGVGTVEFPPEHPLFGGKRQTH